MKGNETVEIIEIAEGVKTIEANTFEGFKKLTSITIGKDVNKIGDNAFKDCTAQTQIKYNGKAVTCSEKVFGDNVKQVVVTKEYTGSKMCGKTATKAGTNTNNNGTTLTSIFMIILTLFILF